MRKSLVVNHELKLLIKVVLSSLMPIIENSVAVGSHVESTSNACTYLCVYVLHQRSDSFLSLSMALIVDTNLSLVAGLYVMSHVSVIHQCE